MSFHEIQFPTSISRNSEGGPVRLTDVVVLRSGFERRNSIWANARRKYDAGLGIRGIGDLYDAYEFFEGREGMLYGFRWKDWLDFKSCKPHETVSASDQNIGTGDGSTTVFQLKKTYTSGSSTISRDVTKPIVGTVLVSVNGSPVLGACDHTKGKVFLQEAPPLGSEVTAGFEFDVPARFDQDEFMVNLDHFEAGAVPNLKVIEIRVAPTEVDLNDPLALPNGFDYFELENALEPTVEQIWPEILT